MFCVFHRKFLDPVRRKEILPPLASCTIKIVLRNVKVEESMKLNDGDDNDMRVGKKFLQNEEGISPFHLPFPRLLLCSHLVAFFPPPSYCPWTFALLHF